MRTRDNRACFIARRVPAADAFFFFEITSYRVFQHGPGPVHERHVLDGQRRHGAQLDQLAGHSSRGGPAVRRAAHAEEGAERDGLFRPRDGRGQSVDRPGRDVDLRQVQRLRPYVRRRE